MSIEMMNNLESVGEMMGALRGMCEGLEENLYMETVIKQAHGRTTNAFDVAAAAAGSAGHIKHVFEFGTAGITPGTVKYPDPTSPAARLWKHQLTGQGGQQDIGYTFRPALNRNPQPTTESTGVPSKYLRRLSRRKYIFWNKAFVMETGQTVEIKSKRGDKGFLFVPTPGKNAPKNFVMYPSKIRGPIRAVPGQNTQGSFTAFWMKWWGSMGSQLMEGHMKRFIQEDIERVTRRAIVEANNTKVKPAHAVNVTRVSERAATEYKKTFAMTNARRRNG